MILFSYRPNNFLWYVLQPIEDQELSTDCWSQVHLSEDNVKDHSAHIEMQFDQHDEPPAIFGFLD